MGADALKYSIPFYAASNNARTGLKYYIGIYCLIFLNLDIINESLLQF